MHSFITITLATLSALTAAAPHARNQFSYHHIREVAPIVGRDNAPLAGREVPGTLNLSPVGVCGGASGYQCAPGFCCSQWGYCGTTDEYCGAGSSITNTTSGGGPNKSHPRPGRHGHGRPHKSPPAYTSPPQTSPTAAPTNTAAPTYSPPASPTTSAAPAPTASSPSSSGGSWSYKMFSGDGSTADGWPSDSQWLDFDTAFAGSTPNMKVSCAQFPGASPDDSDTEIADIKSAISSIASQSGVDERFILAIIMQESNGCVRVPVTDNGIRNPGLMQSHDGPGSCAGTNPCPASEITQMITDGTEGTASGDGLKQCMAQSSATGAQQMYQAAVIYNSGNLPADLGDNTATPCYASDVANRLMGWFSGTSSCTL